MPDDAELLRRYAQGDAEDAFQMLVERRFDLVYAVALRQLGGDTHGARDVAQSVFLDVARKAPALARHPAFLGWLHTAARLAARKLQRTAARRQAREQAMAATLSVTLPEDLPALEALWPLLDAELDRLNARDREAILQRFFSAKSFVEVGQSSGLSANAARMAVERALERLRRGLGRRGITTSAAALTTALESHGATAAPPGVGAAVASHILTQLPIAATAMGAGVTTPLLVMTKLTTCLVAAIGAVAVGAGLYCAHQARAVRASEGAIARSNQHLVLPFDSDSTPAARPSPPRPAAAPDKTPVTRRGHGQGANFSTDIVQRETAENPQFRSVICAMLAARFKLQNARLFKQMGLSEAQIDQLWALTLAQISDKEDLYEAKRRSSSGAAADPAAQTALDESYDEIENRYNQAVSNLIGAQAADQFQDFEKTLPARTLAAQISSAVAYSPTPLTPAQTDTLVQLIQANSTFNPGKELPTDIQWSALLNQAQGVLSPEQVAALSSVQAAQDASSFERQYRKLAP